jgi:hypothetical protein
MHLLVFLHVKRVLLHSNFNQNLNVSIHFSKISHYHIYLKFIQLFWCYLNIRMGGHIDILTLKSEIYANFCLEDTRNCLKSPLENIRILKHGYLFSSYKQNWAGNIVKPNLGLGNVLDCTFSWNPLPWSRDKPLNPRSHVVWILAAADVLMNEAGP